ncbi:hypothetical protein MKX03_008421, partial [Papaver bracteatum]
FMHVLNMAITILSSLKLLIKDEKLWWVQYGQWWFAFAIVNTILGFAWDIFIDWDM